MAHRLFKRALIATAMATLVALTLIACGGDDNDSDPSGTPQPATPTAAPTPIPASTPIKPAGEANSMPGFIAALQTLNKELASGSVDGLIARFNVADYACKASDLAPGLGQPECKTAGEVIHGFQTSGWRSEGGLRRVEGVIENLKGYQTGFDTSKTDAFGPGTFRVFAYDPTKTTAVLTVTSKCLPQYQCPASGFQRLVFVPAFEHIDGRWQISSLMYAFVLGEEFLDPPSAEVKQRMPQYTKF